MAHRAECTTATNTTRSSEQAMNEMLAAALNVVEVDGEVPTLDGVVPLGMPPASMQMRLRAAAETILNVGPEQDTEADSSWIDGLIVVEDIPHGEFVGADSEEDEALASRVGGLTLGRHEACMVGYFMQLLRVHGRIALPHDSDAFMCSRATDHLPHGGYVTFGCTQCN